VRREQHRREVKRRFTEEAETAAAMLGISGRELCRRTGYHERYLATVKDHSSSGEGVTLKFLADVEKVFGCKFEITVILEPKSKGESS